MTISVGDPKHPELIPWRVAPIGSPVGANSQEVLGLFKCLRFSLTYVSYSQNLISSSAMDDSKGQIRTGYVFDWVRNGMFINPWYFALH